MDPPRLTWHEAVALEEARLIFEVEVHQSAEDENRLVLAVVILKREGFARIDVEHLAEIPVGDRPTQLVTPRLDDSRAFGGQQLILSLSLRRIRRTGRGEDAR